MKTLKKQERVRERLVETIRGPRERKRKGGRGGGDTISSRFGGSDMHTLQF